MVTSYVCCYRFVAAPADPGRAGRGATVNVGGGGATAAAGAGHEQGGARGGPETTENRRD